MSASRRMWLVWTLVLAALVVLSGFLARRGGVTGVSALSRSADGLVGARTYLERRGARVVLADAPPADLTSDDAVVLAFPMSPFAARADFDGIRRGVTAGGTLVVAYSGRPRSGSEDAILSSLGLELERVRGEAPLAPFDWWRYESATWRLEPDASLGALAPEIEVHAPVMVPRAPEGASVLYRGERGVAVVFVRSWGRGRVLALPADALSNGRLASAGSVALLESLRASVPGRIVFDEYHHGLVSPAAAVDAGSAPSLDLLVAELVLVYLTGLLALGRRFGPAWEEQAEISGSTSAFLLGLGALHRRLGHSDDAAARLADAASRLDSEPRRWAAAAAAQSTGEAAFLELARAVGRSQRRRR